MSRFGLLKTFKSKGANSKHCLCSKTKPEGLTVTFKFIILKVPYADDAVLLVAHAELSQPRQEQLIGCVVGLPRIHHLAAQLHHLICQRRQLH